MISPRQLFLKTQHAKEIADALATDKWQTAISYALAETVTQYPLTDAHLGGIRLFVEELLRIGEPIVEIETPQLPQLSHDVGLRFQKEKK